MKIKDYWSERFLQLENASNVMGVQTFEEIQKAFDNAMRQIETEISLWYQKFAVNNSINMAEARKLLSSSELKELKWSINEYIKHGKENGLDGRWIKELQNASAKYHINRLEALKMSVQNELEKVYSDFTYRAENALNGVYTQDYYKTIYEVQKGFKIAWPIGAINERLLSKVILKPWTADGINFSERIWRNKQQLINDIHTLITQDILLGKAPDETIKIIAKKFKVTKNTAGRLIMTEQAYFHSTAQKDAYNELNVEAVEFVATLDMHTSAICREMDGKKILMKDYKPGVTVPPLHPWCRSVTVPYFPDNYTSRAARGKDGKTYYISGNITYNEWFDRYVA